MSRSFLRKKRTRKSANAFRGLALLMCLLVVSPLFAQKSKQRQKELDKRKKEIAQYDQMLRETRQNKKKSLTELFILNKKISAREELISSISTEIAILDKQIAENTGSVVALRQDLEKLKQDYARMVQFAWKNRDSYSRMMYIFAARDFAQAYRRMKYFQQYSDYRKKQAMMIEKTQMVLNDKIVQLEARKNEKKMLLVSQEGEKKSLASEKNEKEETLAQLQSKEHQLKKELEKKKKDAEKLQAAIQLLIKKEIEAARLAAAKKARDSKKPAPKGLTLTPEALELSNSFAGNKGKLPWPVLKGMITEGFGPHQHPTLKGVIVDNHGVEISTTKGALVRALFEGEVKSVGLIPGAGRFVLIRHGEFLTVYNNLSEVYVNTGDKVTTKQNIGIVAYDEEQGRTVLQLQVWKGSVKLDPQEWLSKSSN